MLSVGIQYQIVRGDGKQALLSQLGDIGRYAANLRCMFLLVVQNGSGEEDVYVYVNGVKAEDGSGNRWLLNGYILKPTGYFDAYYDTRTRTGWIKFK